MDFYEVVGQVLALLQRQGRVSYRALKRQFGVDDAFIRPVRPFLRWFRRNSAKPCIEC
jgi:hypothetical protein